MSHIGKIGKFDTTDNYGTEIVYNLCQNRSFDQNSL